MGGSRFSKVRAVLGQHWLGLAGPAPAVRCKARRGFSNQQETRLGSALLGVSWRCVAGRNMARVLQINNWRGASRRGMAGRCLAGPGSARLGKARFLKHMKRTWRGVASQGGARRGMSRCRRARQVSACLGDAGQGEARFYRTQKHVTARPGKAEPGEAWRGKSGLGLAVLGKDFLTE